MFAELELGGRGKAEEKEADTSSVYFTFFFFLISAEWNVKI